jgi:DNA-binding transcriptional LysR family regulator
MKSMLSAITLDQLQVAVAVDEVGTFSGAARRLGRAQSAVSHAVARLEELLDVVVFTRGRRGAAATPEGQAILREARAVLERSDGLLATARSLAAGQEARLAVAVDVMFPRSALLDVLARFQAQFPNTELALHTEALGAVASLVAAGTCELGIGTPIIRRPPGLTGMPLGFIEMVGVVAPTHALASVDSPTERDVADAVQIVLTDRSDLTDGKDQAVLPGRHWRVADLGMKRDLLLQGFGFGGLPSWLVEEDLCRGQLVEAHLPGWMGRRPDYAMHALWRRAEPLGPAGRWLLEALGQGCTA